MTEVLSREEFDSVKIDVDCDTAAAVSNAHGHLDAFVATIEALAEALKHTLSGDKLFAFNLDVEACRLCERIETLRGKGWL